LGGEFQRITKQNDRWSKILFTLTVIIFGLSFYYAVFYRDIKTVRFDEFVEKVSNGEVKKFKTIGNSVEIELKNGTLLKTTKPSEDSTFSSIKTRIGDNEEGLANLYKVQEEIKDPNEGRLIFDLIGYLPMIALAIFVVYFFYSQVSRQGSSALSFGMSRPRLFDARKPKVTFNDVGGIDEVVEELKEIVDFLKFPKKYSNIGAEIPRGVLLVGPPGTGKTLVAKAVAGEASVPFLSISGSEFVEMFVGVGASRVRDLFSKAKKVAPSIVFIDEIDAVGRKRGSGLGGSHDEREQTLNQILVEMDGFDTNQGVIVMAATNRVDVLDKALLRPGRFDRRIVLDLPDIAGRERIIEIYLKGKPISKDVNPRKIASLTPGFSGADIKNVVNEAALWSARNNKKEITMEAFNEAIEKVALGPQKKSRKISPKEKEIVAIHETGHAVVSEMLPLCDPVHKISIISRGSSLGATWSAPFEENYLITKEKFIQDLASILGGFAAEKLFFNEVTTGASNDLSIATKRARAMVVKFGMSEVLGPVSYDTGELNFLGQDIFDAREFSEKTAEVIDQEVQGILKESLNLARKTLEENRSIVEKISKRLLEIETMDVAEFQEFFKKSSKKNQKWQKL